MPAQEVPVFWRRKRVSDNNFVIDTNFRVVHEDSDILILDKPSPLAVHPVGVYAELNLHSLLKNDPRRAGQSVRFVHRLDAETSGLICAAKTEAAARFLGIEFMNGRVDKTYHALVFGTPERSEGEINARLGHDAGSGFQTVRIADEVNGEEALTRYKVVSSAGGYSWLEITPLTGRTHQIRVHLALLGHPIVGDKIYIDLNLFREYVLGGLNEEILNRLKLPRLALHASRLSFTHPGTRERVGFHCPAPDFLKDVRP